MKKKPDIEALTYSIAELAKIIGCSERKTRELDAERSLPGRITIGRRVFYSKSEIHRFLSEGGTTQEAQKEGAK